MSDGRSIRLVIDTLRSDGMTQEREKRTFEGTRHELNDKLYLRYKEVIAEGEEPTPTMLVIEDNDLRLHRSGAYGGDMRFVLGQKSSLSYRTPMGTVEMTVRTEGLDLFISQEKIEISLKYSLSANGQAAVDVVMQIVAD